MTIGTVLGPVALERGVPGAAEKRFVQVRCGECLVTALDPVGVQKGQTVLLASGERRQPGHPGGAVKKTSVQSNRCLFLSPDGV